MSFKGRSRGNRRSDAVRAKEKQEIVDMLNEGKTKTEMAGELGISRSTLHRQLNELEAAFVEGGKEAFNKLRMQTAHEFLEKAKQVLDGSVDPDVMNAWTRVMSEFKRTLGLDAPTTSITKRIDAESSPLFLMFKKSISGLSDDQLADAFKYLSGIPREIKPRVVDASWFPTVKKELPE